ncbi:MAG: DUF4258 domain-containing protein [Acidobacteria bacterium]|nr:DUF4258 domain-containing protein [Acidobacteriota bacterium]
MSEIYRRILDLVARDEILVSNHGYDELAADDILVRDILTGVAKGTVIEEYPTYSRGPCVLVLQWDHDSKPIHVVWGIPSHATAPAVIVTAYRPDVNRWASDFLRRKS